MRGVREGSIVNMRQLREAAAWLRIAAGAATVTRGP